jgi:hypothetical protein
VVCVALVLIVLSPLTLPGSEVLDAKVVHWSRLRPLESPWGLKFLDTMVGRPLVAYAPKLREHNKTNGFLGLSQSLAANRTPPRARMSAEY